MAVSTFPVRPGAALGPSGRRHGRPAGHQEGFRCLQRWSLGRYHRSGRRRGVGFPCVPLGVGFNAELVGKLGCRVPLLMAEKYRWCS